MSNYLKIEKQLFYHVMLLIFLLCFPFLCGGGRFSHVIMESCGLALWVILMFGYGLIHNSEIKITIPDLLIIAVVIFGMLRMVWGVEKSTWLHGIEWFSLLGLYIVIRRIRFHRVLWYGITLTGIVQAFVGDQCFQNPGPYGGFIAISWIACGGVMLTEKKIYKKWRCILFCIISLIFVWTLIRSDSRTAWIAAVVGYSWLGVLFFPVALRHIYNYVQQHKWLILLGIVMMLITVFLLYSYKSGSVHGRWLIWQVCGRMFTEAPLIGQGYGTFEKEYMYAQAVFFREMSGVEYGIYAGDNCQAFNEGLHLLCELGIIGGMLVSSLLFLLLRKRLSESIAQSIGIGLLVLSCFSYPASVPALKIYYVLLTAVLVNEIGFHPLYCWKLKPIYSWLIGICLIWSIIFIVHLLVFIERAECVLKQAIKDKRKLTEALAYFSEMQEQADYVLCLGRQLYLNEDYQNASLVLKQAAKLQPTTGILCDLGSCYQQLGQYDEAENTLLIARDMIPNRIRARYLLFCLYRETEEKEKAQHIAVEILQTKVKIINSFTLDVKKEIREYLKFVSQ